MSIVYDSSYIDEEFVNDNESLFFPTSYESNYSFNEVFKTLKVNDLHYQLNKNYYLLVIHELRLYFKDKEIIKLKYRLVLKDILIHLKNNYIKEYKVGYDIYKALII